MSTVKLKFIKISLKPYIHNDSYNSSGVPGGAVMAAVGLLESMLGFSGTAVGLMIALYMAQDSFGTATNVTGDGAIAIIVDKMMGTNKAA